MMRKRREDEHTREWEEVEWEWILDLGDEMRWDEMELSLSLSVSLSSLYILWFSLWTNSYILDSNLSCSPLHCCLSVSLMILPALPFLNLDQPEPLDEPCESFLNQPSQDVMSGYLTDESKRERKREDRRWWRIEDVVDGKQASKKSKNKVENVDQNLVPPTPTIISFYWLWFSIDNSRSTSYKQAIKDRRWQNSQRRTGIANLPSHFDS